MTELLNTEGQTRVNKRTDYGAWHAEFDQQAHLCFAGTLAFSPPSQC